MCSRTMLLLLFYIYIHIVHVFVCGGKLPSISYQVFDRKSLTHHCNILSKYKPLKFQKSHSFSEVQFVFKIIYNASSPPLESFLYVDVCLQICLYN